MYQFIHALFLPHRTRGTGQHHQDDMEGAIANLKLTLLDHLAGNFWEERLLQLEKDWIIRLGTFGPTGLNTRNQLLSQQKKLGTRPLIIATI